MERAQTRSCSSAGRAVAEEQRSQGFCADNPAPAEPSGCAGAAWKDLNLLVLDVASPRPGKDRRRGPPAARQPPEVLTQRGTEMTLPRKVWFEWNNLQNFG